MHFENSWFDNDILYYCGSKLYVIPTKHKKLNCYELKFEYILCILQDIFAIIVFMN